MANRRMITRDIVRSDGFITLPFSFQVLYLHLTIEADDAGFVGSPKSVLRLSGCSDGDINELEKSGYIYRFESGVVLLRPLESGQHRAGRSPEIDHLSE